MLERVSDVLGCCGSEDLGGGEGDLRVPTGLKIPHRKL